MERGIKKNNISEKSELTRLLKKSGFSKADDRIWKRGKDAGIAFIIDIDVAKSCNAVAAIGKIVSVIPKKCSVIVNDGAENAVFVKSNRAILIAVGDKTGVVAGGCLSGYTEIEFIAKNCVKVPAYANKAAAEMPENASQAITVINDTRISVDFVNEDKLDAVIMQITAASNKTDKKEGSFYMMEVKKYVPPIDVSERLGGYFKLSNLQEICLDRNISGVCIDALEKSILFYDGDDDAVIAAIKRFSEEIYG